MKRIRVRAVFGLTVMVGLAGIIRAEEAGEKKAETNAEQVIREKIIFYAPFEGNFFARGIQGREYQGEFGRGTRAFDPDDAREYRVGEPIFKEGRFGKGIYLIHGAAAPNLLALNQSDVEEGLEGFVPEEGVDISRQAGGWHGKYSLAVNIANRGKGFYIGGVKGTTVHPEVEYAFYNASLYLKGDKGGEKLKIRIEDKTNAQVSEPLTVTLEKNWKKYWTGDVARLRDLTADDLRIYVVSDSETPVKFYADGLEIAWAKNYPHHSVGTDWMPGGEARATDFLLFSVPEGLNMKEGAVSMWYKPMAPAGRNPGSANCTMLYIVNQTTPYQCKIWLGGGALNLRGRVGYPGAPKTGEYCFAVFSWDAKGGVYYLNSEVKASIPAEYNEEKDGFKPGDRIQFSHVNQSVPNGIVDEITFYKTPLSGEEVKVLYELKKPLKPLP